MSRGILRRVGVLSAGLALTAGLALVAVPASATATFADLCNSSGSVEPIMVHAPRDGAYNLLINPGGCIYGYQTADLRVDVDPAGGVDVDSYRIKSGSTWGPCHSGETNDSDPPNVSNVAYKNYTNSNCSGNG